MRLGQRIIQPGAIVQFGFVQDLLPHQQRGGFTAVHPHRFDLKSRPRDPPHRQPDVGFVCFHGSARSLARAIDTVSARTRVNRSIESVALVCTTEY